MPRSLTFGSRNMNKSSAPWEARCVPTSGAGSLCSGAMTRIKALAPQWSPNSGALPAPLRLLTDRHTRARSHPKLVAMSESDINRTIEAAGISLRRVSALGQINPVRWFARRRLRRIIASLGVTPVPGTARRLLEAAKLEKSLRPLRERLDASLKRLFESTGPLPVLTPAKLATLATNAHAVLSRIGTLASIVAEFPRAAELEQAVRLGTPKAIGGLSRPHPPLPSTLWRKKC